MSKKAIHEQIAVLTEKISYLNEKISNENKLHPVELDLLNGYVRELNQLVIQLQAEKIELPKSESSVIIKEEKIESTKEFPVTEVSDKKPEQKKEPETKKTPEPERIVQQQPETPEPVLTEDIILPEPETVEQVEVIVEEVKPLMEAVKHELEEEVIIKRKATTTTVKEKQKEAVSLNERFKKDSNALADKLNVSQKKSLKDLFGLNERYTFISGLFGGSTEQFNKVMQELGKCASRDEAEKYLDEVKSKYSWGEKQQETAEKFTDSVLNTLN